MSEHPVANLIVAPMNVNIGPNFAVSRKPRSQIEIGKAGSRDAIPALELDHKDVQADGETRQLEQTMRFIGSLLRDR